MAGTNINFTNAETYFATENHMQSDVWSRFTSQQKTAAIEQAIRILGRCICGTSVFGTFRGGSTATYGLYDGPWDTGDYIREDYAVYEQAIYMLKNTDAITNGEFSGPKFISKDTAEPGEEAPKPLICSEALRWLGYPKFSKFKVQRG